MGGIYVGAARICHNSIMMPSASSVCRPVLHKVPHSGVSYLPQRQH